MCVMSVIFHKAVYAIYIAQRSKLMIVKFSPIVLMQEHIHSCLKLWLMVNFRRHIKELDQKNCRKPYSSGFLLASCLASWFFFLDLTNVNLLILLKISTRDLNPWLLLSPFTLLHPFSWISLIFSNYPLKYHLQIILLHFVKEYIMVKTRSAINDFFKTCSYS